jgi:hypothetical protein
VITNDDRRSYDQLGRNLAAAFIAARFNLGLDHAYRWHIKNAALPDYWIDLAMKVERDAAKSAGAGAAEGTGELES